MNNISCLSLFPMLQVYMLDGLGIEKQTKKTVKSTLTEGSCRQVSAPKIEKENEAQEQREVVLSIRPKYSGKILQGDKTVELRRRFPETIPVGTTAYIYSTSPEQAMVGLVKIKKILRLSLMEVWDDFKDLACIERKDFEAYFQGLDSGFALVLEGVKSFSPYIPLSELREHCGFKPPQSFIYASHDLQRVLRDE